MFDIENEHLRKYIADGYETSVTIPHGVSIIDKGAFVKCEHLTTITLPESVRYIDGSAFCSCPALTTLRLNDGLSSLGDYRNPAFVDCPSIKHLELPASLVQPYSYVPDVVSISISDGVRKIPDGFFRELASLESVYLPDSVEVIGQGAFSECVRLSHVRMPAHLTEIGLMAFWECRMLRDIDIPDSVRKIGNDCFRGSGITNVRIPSGITKIEECTFENCLNLHSIVIPETVQEIHKRAFNGSGLRNIRIPARVQVVGEGTFGGCNFLTDVTICSRDTKFVKHIVPMFPENARLHGDGYRIPGPWKYEKITALFLALLIINSINTLLLIAALVGLYFYIKRKHQFLSLKKEDERKAIIDIEFARPWYKRVPVIEDNLPEYLRWGND